MKKHKFICRECKQPCKLKFKAASVDDAPFKCPFYGNAKWEEYKND